MIGRLIVAIAYGVLVGIVVLIVGVVISTLGVAPLTALGHSLRDFCWAFGVIAAVVAFFGGWQLPGR